MLVQASPKVVDMVSRYDRSAEEVHKARKQFAHISQVLVNLVTVRFRADAPPGYGTTWDMSKTELPDLKKLGDQIHEWQSIRAEMIKMLADPATDDQSCMFLDSKLHVRAGAC